jgi:hypothetical protein
MRLLVSVVFAAILAAPGPMYAQDAPADRQGAGETPETARNPLALVDEGSQPDALRALQEATSGTRPADGYQPVLGQASGGATDVRPALGVKLDAGRDTAGLGRLPSDPRQTYGEVGLAIDLGESLSLVPSYRLNWTDSEEDDQDGAADHALKLGANFKF